MTQEKPATRAGRQVVAKVRALAGWTTAEELADDVAVLVIKAEKQAVSELTREQRQRDAEIGVQLDAIGERLQETLGMSRVLLADRLIRDGHAKNFGAAMRLAKDLDKVAELYPVPVP